jgi:hypothetical protein
MIRKKPAPHLDCGWEPVFLHDKRESALAKRVGAEIMLKLNNELRRDGDSI